MNGVLIMPHEISTVAPEGLQQCLSFILWLILYLKKKEVRGETEFDGKMYSADRHNKSIKRTIYFKTKTLSIADLNYSCNA